MSGLYFDVETTGLLNFKLPLDDETQPRIIQIAALIRDDKGRSISQFCTLIKPDGWTIPAKAQRIHGFSTEDCERYGVKIESALGAFKSMQDKSSLIVAHNYNFDSRMIRRETIALKAADVITRPSFCTMLSATKIVKLPGSRGYKWPKLSECMLHFYNEEIVGAHDAMVDVIACSRVHEAIIKHEGGED